jgi:aminoglycoside phosphotransferase (APT) family kinase protein
VSSHEVGAALEPWFAARLGVDEARVSELRRHAEGFSWETYTLTVEAGGERHGYAVRVEPRDGLLAPYDIRGQYALHRAVVDHSDVPMPALHWLELDATVLGMPFFVMERLDGVVPVQWRGKDPSIFPSDEARRAIGLEFVDVLTRIHAIDHERAGLAFLGAHTSGDDAGRAQIEHWGAYYAESVLVELPLVRHALGWLRSNVATSGLVCLCHGDYRIGNFMLDGERRIVGVFDWELAHLSDPVEDIAYAGLPLFRGRSPLLSQLLAPDEFFARYEELTGTPVSPEAFRFWTVLGLVKTIASFMRGVRAFEEGRNRDLRLAAMGHQVQHTLRYLADALELVGGRGPEARDLPAPQF